MMERSRRKTGHLPAPAAIIVAIHAAFLKWLRQNSLRRKVFRSVDKARPGRRFLRRPGAIPAFHRADPGQSALQASASFAIG
jgi:hypothetical protein